jgi:hypothetical protein
MAWNKDIVEVFANYSATGTDFTIPFSDFPDLDATEGDATPSGTGDSRKFLYGFVKAVYDSWFDGLADADKPSKMDIRQSSRSDNDTGETITTFSFEFRTTATSVEVSNE